MLELKSCPYCKGGAELKQWTLPGRSTPLYYVVCTDCGAMTWPYIADPSAAVKRWNTRKLEVAE